MPRGRLLDLGSGPGTFLMVARRTAKSLLKTNGLLFLSVPNLDDPFCLQQWMLRKRNRES